MQGPAKRSRHIMFTEAQLVTFGNFLFQRYNVQVHSSDGKNQPIYQREVTDADICNWKVDSDIPDKNLPSQHQVGDKVYFCCMPAHTNRTDFPAISAEVLAVHFYNNKVKYDLDLLFAGDQRSRIYNVDEVLVPAKLNANN